MNPDDLDEDFFWDNVRPYLPNRNPSEANTELNDYYSHPYDWDDDGDDDFLPWDSMGPRAVSLLEQESNQLEQERAESRVTISNLERELERVRADLANYRYWCREAELTCNLYRRAITGQVTMAEFAQLPKPVRQAVWERYISHS